MHRYKCWFWNELDLTKMTCFKWPDDGAAKDEFVILVVGCGKERNTWVYKWPTNMEAPPPVVSQSCAAAIKSRKSAQALAEKFQMASARALYAKYDAQQLALKQNCNSIYGFYGVKHGPNEFYFISQTICLIGRILNFYMESVLKTRYGRDCIYGDTDSVMVRYPNELKMSLEQIAQEGIDSSRYITSQLPTGIKLAFENIKKPSIWYTAKGYAYMKVWCEKRGLLPGLGEFKSQGLANKRRNYCVWARKTCSAVLKLLLRTDIESEPERADLIHQTVSEADQMLEKSQVDIGDLTRTCKIQESYKKGTQKLAQKSLVDRMRRRGQIVKGGERVRYLYFAGGGPISDRAELPDAMGKKQIDRVYYREELFTNLRKLLQFHPQILSRVTQIHARSHAITDYFFKLNR